MLIGAYLSVDTDIPTARFIHKEYMQPIEMYHSRQQGQHAAHTPTGELQLCSMSARDVEGSGNVLVLASASVAGSGEIFRARAAACSGAGQERVSEIRAATLHHVPMRAWCPRHVGIEQEGADDVGNGQKQAVRDFRARESWAPSQLPARERKHGSVNGMTGQI
jgi:hypothetical protein